jgi:predicted O-methyltransferase YrrM
MTMLSLEERRLLYWLAREYFAGNGAIVDGGSFVGGSTVALGEGLRANHRAEPGSRIHAFDRFEVNQFMAKQIFEPKGLAYTAGDSFRPLFDRQTDAVRDLLEVHAGDLAELGWSGGPIEILFIDVAKSWLLNDVIIDQFFPSLVPGRSVVVQQDLVFSLYPWLALTMEHLHEEFEPVAYVECNSVVYLCRRRVREGVSRSLHELTTEQRLELMDRAIGRFRGYPRGLLRLARAVLLRDCGLEAEARAEAAAARREHGDHWAVEYALMPLRDWLSEG